MTPPRVISYALSRGALGTVVVIAFHQLGEFASAEAGAVPAVVVSVIACAVVGILLEVAARRIQDRVLADLLGVMHPMRWPRQLGRALASSRPTRIAHALGTVAAPRTATVVRDSDGAKPAAVSRRYISYQRVFQVVAFVGFAIIFRPLGFPWWVAAFVVGGSFAIIGVLHLRQLATWTVWYRGFLEGAAARRARAQDVEALASV